MNKTLNKKIDFAIIMRVVGANPNGDPLADGRPRVTDSGLGYLADVCIKRKLRNRLQDEGKKIFVQSDARATDGFNNLKARAEASFGKNMTSKELVAKACEEFTDVRFFGQVLAWKDKEDPKAKKGKKTQAEGTEETTVTADDGPKSVSISIKGPVSIQDAYSIQPITTVETQITKSVNSTVAKDRKGEDTDGMSSDRMGMRYRVWDSTYVLYGGVSPFLAENTGFSDEDAETLKVSLKTLFENDESSARPAGSMEVAKVIWWEHNCKKGQYSSAKVHRSLKVNPDGSFLLENLAGLQPEIIEGW